MTDSVWTPGVTNHFVTRAVERIGCTEDEAREIGQGLAWAIERERWDLVRFVSRVNREGQRIFRFRHAPTKRHWYALVNTDTMTCITILHPGFDVRRQGKSKIRLREEDL